MRGVAAETIVTGVGRPLVWRVLADVGRLASIAGHVLDASPAPDGAQRWSVLLNGSRVDWVQRTTERPPAELRFEQVDGDFDRLRGSWTLHEHTGGTRLRLELEFHLGVDGLAPLLDPIWAQSLQAHADAMVSAVSNAANAADATGRPERPEREGGQA
jgi:Polyketide cyclase / dehydrase and lipid transport